MSIEYCQHHSESLEYGYKIWREWSNDAQHRLFTLQNKLIINGYWTLIYIVKLTLILGGGASVHPTPTHQRLVCSVFLQHIVFSHYSAYHSHKAVICYYLCNITCLPSLNGKLHEDGDSLCLNHYWIPRGSCINRHSGDDGIH